MARFSDDEVRRYARQMLMPEVGGVGQERLRAARAAAESEVEALYLAAAGVGFLTVGSEMTAEAVRGVNPNVSVTVSASVEPAAGGESVEQAALRAVAKIKQVLEL